MMAMKQDEIKQQSLNAYNQWKDLWRKHAKTLQKKEMKNINDFLNHGVGRACLLVGNGYSLEENIETIKANQDNVDIICCDKSLGHLIDNGITPDYCIVCDAVVDYEKYLQPYEDKLENTTLFAVVTCNPKWHENGNWKDQYFFVNQDCLQSELEFSELSGCTNFIPAATNVSNAMLVFITQSDNHGRKNFFGYDKILLIGYDFSWRFDGGYYAFDYEGNGKRYYMKHTNIITLGGTPGYTSNNLVFSCRWIQDYVKIFKLPVIQCTKETILSSVKTGNLEEQMQYSYKPEDKTKVSTLIRKRDKLMLEASQINNDLVKIGEDHYYNYLATT